MSNRMWTSTKQRPIEERLAEKIDRKGPDDCWPCRCEPCKADNARVAREYRSSRRVVQA